MQPKFKSQSQIYIWDLDEMAYFCRNNDDCGKHRQMTHITKMGADRLAKNTPKFIYTNCLAKPKILAFQWKQSSSGVCSQCPQDRVNYIICLKHFKCQTKLHFLYLSTPKHLVGPKFGSFWKTACCMNCVLQKIQ